jgi:hypothetical protein
MNAPPSVGYHNVLWYNFPTFAIKVSVDAAGRMVQIVLEDHDSSNFNMTRMAIPGQEAAGSELIGQPHVSAPTPPSDRCRCDIRDLMLCGCTCGTVNRALRTR